MLEGSLLSDEKFAAWSKDFVLFCHITTRITDRKYEKLLSEKKGTGFPYLVFMNGEGDLIAAMRGARTMETLAKTGATAAQNAKLRTLAASGDAGATFDWLVYQAQVGWVSFDEARTAFAALGNMTPAQKSKADETLVVLEIGYINNAVARGKMKPEDGRARTIEIYTSGKMPSEKDGMRTLLSAAFNAYYSKEDVANCEKVLNDAKRRLGTEADAKAFLDLLASRIDRMKHPEKYAKPKLANPPAK
jgi:hypothetical protein